jgi:hypothetical protein
MNLQQIPIVAVVFTVILGQPYPASADPFSCNWLAAGTNCWQPSPADLKGLDRRTALTWRIDDVGLPLDSAIVAATLAFTNIAASGAQFNQLYIHLLDTADRSGVAWFQDVTDDSDTSLRDDFSGWTAKTNALINGSKPDQILLVTPKTYDSNGNGTLESSFGTTARMYVYGFTREQLETLGNFIANGGDLAFGIDPEGSFGNEGVTFQIQTTPSASLPRDLADMPTETVPEPTGILLLATVAGCVAVVVRVRKRGRLRS